MTTQPSKPPLDLDALEKLAEVATKLAPLPWNNASPSLWISSAVLPQTGMEMHVADIRGWGHLIGLGGGLAMDRDAAFEQQKAWAAFILSAVNSQADLIALARRAEKLEAIADELASDLKAELDNGYSSILHFPSARLKYEQDMEPIRKLQALRMLDNELYTRPS